MRLVVTFLLGVLFFISGCDRITGPAAPTVLQVDDLYKELKASPDAFKTKYVGKDVVILGKVMGGKFDPSWEFTSLDTKTVKIVGSSEDVLFGVSCEVEKPDSQKFEGVDGGMALTVTGKLTLKDDKYIYLRPCKREFKK